MQATPDSGAGVVSHPSDQEEPGSPPRPAPVDRVVTGPVVVGAGPAGLMLTHRLGRTGIDCVNIDLRSRAEIEARHRAGILEAGAPRDLVDTGVSDRILRDGHEHDGTSCASPAEGTASTSVTSSGGRSGCTRRATSSATSRTRATGTVARSTTA